MFHSNKLFAEINARAIGSITMFYFISFIMEDIESQFSDVDCKIHVINSSYIEVFVCSSFIDIPLINFGIVEGGTGQGADTTGKGGVDRVEFSSLIFLVELLFSVWGIDCSELETSSSNWESGISGASNPALIC